MVESTPATSGLVVGRYVIFGEIAAGGMATVHLGRLVGEGGFSRTVAIKRLHPHMARDEDFTRMFLDEARLAARIRHPNVVPTLDVVALDGELCLVMEYVAGESLARLHRAQSSRKEPAPAEVTVAIAVGALSGLHAAHEATDEKGEPLHLVHRDVSPQNILVGTDGLSRVLDFGIAKAARRLHSTHGKVVKGKVSYMAPEQIRSGDVDRRVDVYAMAVVLWEELTGKRLFDAEDDVAVMSLVLEGHIEAPSKHAPGISPELEQVVMRGLSADPAERFATANEMAIALEKASACASSRAVAAWVESLAAQKLRSRASRVALVESVSEDELSDLVSGRLSLPPKLRDSSRSGVDNEAPPEPLAEIPSGGTAQPQDEQDALTLQMPEGAGAAVLQKAPPSVASAPKLAAVSKKAPPPPRKLKKCPKCGLEAPAAASRCIYCGTDMTGGWTPPPERSQGPARAHVSRRSSSALQSLGGWGKTALVWIGVALIPIPVVIGFLLWRDAQSTEDTATASEPPMPATVSTEMAGVAVPLPESSEPGSLLSSARARVSRIGHKVRLLDITATGVVDGKVDLTRDKGSITYRFAREPEAGGGEREGAELVLGRRAKESSFKVGSLDAPIGDPGCPWGKAWQAASGAGVDAKGEYEARYGGASGGKTSWIFLDPARPKFRVEIDGATCAVLQKAPGRRD